jgi:hypothetical protein
LQLERHFSFHENDGDNRMIRHCVELVQALLAGREILRDRP